MTTVGEHISTTDAAICSNIDALTDKRDLLAQNILSQLRNLVEGVAVRAETGTPDAVYDYEAIKRGETFIKARGDLRFLRQFHDLLQMSTSHYAMDGDTSERLMLKYYEFLIRLRTLMQDTFATAVLANLHKFPVDLDPAMQEYHEKIAARIRTSSATNATNTHDRYYIHKTRPFFVDGRVYYEVTFHRAINRISKFDRIIAFTDIDMTADYSAELSLARDTIDVLGQTMPITIIRDWKVSIRPCEFRNFARLLGVRCQVNKGSAEYRYLMNGLTTGGGSLLDLIAMEQDAYDTARTNGIARTPRPQIFPVLDEARRVIRSSLPGHNVIRYLLLRLHNETLKPQYNPETCSRLSGLHLAWGCIPFDDMPFCTSPIRHNPRYWDLMRTIDPAGRTHELLARHVRSNVERNGTLYTPLADLDTFDDLPGLVDEHNQRLYYKHTARELVIDKGHLFIRGYEDDTVSIVERLQQHAASGINGYTPSVDHWLGPTPRGIDDDAKRDALRELFSNSRVAVIYGAAGTGKSTMVNHIANYFNTRTKLFLAHTNPAKDNLERRVTAQDSTFRTIASHMKRAASDIEYDVLVIDECSTVSNNDLLEVLQRTKFKLLVLVGDVYQIESIRFGNWFGIAGSFLPDTAVFELKTPFRTTNEHLLGFWNKVRNLSGDIAEAIAHQHYSTVLDNSLFAPRRPNEIILCLNYDGLYGINNINRFLQSSNPNPPVTWRDATFKVDDPVLFNDSERFRPVVWNNLKGSIVAIETQPGQIQFDVRLDRPVSDFDVSGTDLTWIEGSTVRFTVYDYDTSDEDDDDLTTSVPFQVAYAVSIHKAQGLEYDSVKVVITGANEEDVTHAIFYTAVTRAREALSIFWTPETQQAVLSSLTRASSRKDVAIMTARRGLTPR